MKTTQRLPAAAICAAAAMLIGCGKTEQSAPAAASEAPKSVQEAPATPAQPPQAAPQLSLPSVEEAKTAVTAPAESEAQSLIEKAQGLIAQNKYSDALNVLNQLASLKLTPEQQKLVDDLKAQVQKAMANEAAAGAGKAIGNVLGGGQ